MSRNEAPSWPIFAEVVQDFFGRHKIENYRYLVTTLVLTFHDISKTMGMHYLFSHLDSFPETFGDVSEEQGDRFHQGLKELETLF